MRAVAISSPEIYRPSGRSRLYDLFRKSGIPLRKLPERYLAHHYELFDRKGLPVDETGKPVGSLQYAKKMPIMNAMAPSHRDREHEKKSPHKQVALISVIEVP